MYEFINSTWNTVKGECPHGCSYCYMHRWGKQKPVRFDEKELKTDLGSGNFIFVGSSCDMFADDIPISWIMATLDHCLKFDNQYLFQTKNPGRFITFASHPVVNHKSVICTTIESNNFYKDIMVDSPTPLARSIAMEAIPIPKYVTIEPIIDFDLNDMITMIMRCNPEQVNIGADTGNNLLPEPSSDKIRTLISELSKFTIVHLKSNLKRLLK